MDGSIGALELMDNRVGDRTLTYRLIGPVGQASAACIHVAYLRESGVVELREAMEELLRRGAELRLLTGRDFGLTEPEALPFFRDLDGPCEVRLVSSSGSEGFHPKSYLLYWGPDEASLSVGSSNFTAASLRAKRSATCAWICPRIIP